MSKKKITVTLTREYVYDVELDAEVADALLVRNAELDDTDDRTEFTESVWDADPEAWQRAINGKFTESVTSVIKA